MIQSISNARSKISREVGRKRYRERVAAGAHLPTPWLFEPTKRPDDRTDGWLQKSQNPRGRDETSWAMTTHLKTDLFRGGGSQSDHVTVSGIIVGCGLGVYGTECAHL